MKQGAVLKLKIGLHPDEREAFRMKRKRYMLNITDTATILNCTREHVTDAQVGKFVPSDVYNRITDWMDNWSILRDEELE